MDFGRKVMRLTDFLLHYPVKAQGQQPEAIKIVNMLGEDIREFFSSSLHRTKSRNRPNAYFQVPKIKDHFH
jgi:hypothetical protein